MRPIQTTAYTVRTWMLRGACRLVKSFVRFDPLEHFLVFSDPRGGSTWLAEILLSVPRTALMWEPLNVALVPHFRELDFSLRPYIPSDQEWPAARSQFEALFRGDLTDHWTCHHPFRYAGASRLIVKMCRGNALIPWLTNAFDFTYEPVYLVRHPFAVVSSQMRYGAWADYEGFDVPEGPYDAYYRRHEDYINSLKTVYEGLVAQWCLTNLVPLRSDRNDRDWITVSYEDLLMEPERQIQRIFGRWRMAVPDRAIVAASHASRTTKQATFESGIEAQLAKWRSHFDEEQTDRMLAVLDHFGVDEYGRDVRPSTRKAQSISSDK